MSGGEGREQTVRGPEVPPEARAATHPGDQAPPGTPFTGEDLCPTCGGSGRLEQGEDCPTCGGTGKVIVPVSAGE